VLPELEGATLWRSRDGGLGLLGGEYMALISTFKNELSHYIRRSIPKSVNFRAAWQSASIETKSKRRTIESAVPIKRISSAAIAYRHV
jgi:hypothetical protein